MAISDTDTTIAAKAMVAFLVKFMENSLDKLTLVCGKNTILSNEYPKKAN
jgi:hypothetical protein